LNQRFGALTGFTQQEIETYYHRHIDALADSLGTSKPALLARIKEMYDGFSFDGVARLYNPFSFASLLGEGAFANFWMESGSSSVIRGFIRKHRIDPEQYRGMPVQLNFVRNPGEIDVTPPEGFLYQAGYLSLRKTPEGEYTLDYPNQEVRSSVANLFLDNILPSLSQALRAGSLLRDSLKKGDSVELVRNVYRLFDGICYDDVAGMERQAVAERDDNESFAESLHKRLGEYFYRAVLVTYFRGVDSDVSAERHSSLGRSDIVVRHGQRTYVIGIKLAEDSAGARIAAENGLRQIQANEYGGSFKAPVLISIAIDKVRRNIGFCIISENGVRSCLGPDGQGGLVQVEPEPAPDFPSGATPAPRPSAPQDRKPKP
jgi:hypothetical protein